MLNIKQYIQKIAPSSRSISCKFKVGDRVVNPNKPHNIYSIVRITNAGWIFLENDFILGTDRYRAWHPRQLTLFIEPIGSFRVGQTVRVRHAWDRNILSLILKSI